jgi:hypothetical protein
MFEFVFALFLGRILFIRYYEVVEIYRRMLFIAALPVLAPQGLQRAALGCVLSIFAVFKVVGILFVYVCLVRSTLLTNHLL